MPGELKEFTLAEVAMRNGKGGTPTWIVIRDLVYDVTSYIENHPGGSELIVEWAGKDGTKDFEAFGHSSDAMRILRTLQVGILAQARNRQTGGAKTISAGMQSEENLAEKKRSKRRKFILCG